VGLLAHAKPPTWRTSVSLFVWVITLDLSGMGGPTSSKRYRQHSFWDHGTTQAPPLRQSRDTFGGTFFLLHSFTYTMGMTHFKIKFLMLIMKSSIFGTTLNQRNMRETNLYLNNSYTCWLDKSFASKYKLDKY
jgi:hypothetical protein